MERATQVVKPVPEGEMTFEEFLAWGDEDTHAEWVKGKVIPKMPASVKHQESNSFLHLLIGSWVQFHQVGKVFHPPLLVRLTLPNGDTVAREPDLVVLLNAHLDRLREQYVEGAPDLIVEIVSPSYRATDRGEKFYEYEAAGVPEYWMIDPDRQYAEFVQLDEQGVYGVVLSGSKGVYRSKVLDGFWLQVEWLWQQPSVWEVFKAWALR
jgi:Uma2 family endonuclease